VYLLLPTPIGPTSVADVDPATVYADSLRAPHSGRPWVLANMVASVDGRAAVHGRTSALSGIGDRAVFKLLRTLADVVVVGAGTVRAERYGPVREGHRPPIAVISRSLDLDWDSDLFRDVAQATEVLTCEAADPARLAVARKVAEVIMSGDKQVDLARALAELGNRGHRVVLCEGGPHLLGQLVAADLVDELCFTLTPLLAGGVEPSLIVAPSFDPPRPLRLTSVIEDDGALLLRYLRAPSGT
jgi:riboflavin biosynthesis pyrimidine reductase